MDIGFRPYRLYVTPEISGHFQIFSGREETDKYFLNSNNGPSNF